MTISPSEKSKTSVRETEKNINQTTIMHSNATSLADSSREKTREREEKEESSSSTGSDGKGNSSGSGSGGYNADCSSSDTSSNNDTATGMAQKQMKSLTSNSSRAQTGQENNLGKESGVLKTRSNNAASNDDNTKNSTGTTAHQSRSISMGQSSGTRRTRDDSKINSIEDTTRAFPVASKNHTNGNISKSVLKEAKPCLPQWNGVKIIHPMDPRIDLSTVGFCIGGSNNVPLLSNLKIGGSNKSSNAPCLGSIKSAGEKDAIPNNKCDASDGSNSNIPSVDQYTKLLESVRPFFKAHGIDAQSYAMSTPSSKGSKEAKETHTEINKTVGDLLVTAKNELAAAFATAAALAGPQGEDENDKDSSSMVVLARPKRKNSKKQEGTDSNSGRSSSSSEEELRGQEQQLPLDQDANREHPGADENGGDNQADGEHALQHPQEQQNLLVGAPRRYGMNAMVSEYSSSNRNTSGSGSGGNTGSGTGSGSNQGGSSGSGPSSGSGNDQEGISSNGNGSSGSGNNKGSSEEINGESNSTENSNDNSDQNSPIIIKDKQILHEDKTNTNRFSPNHSEPSLKRSQHQNAAREKKLQDKKRKRMNMRRVYEDQIELDMGSSESSVEQGILRPGKPVTIDTAISFTKTAKLLVQACPSLTVIHTNAAFCRLSGIDSHDAVGSPLASLLFRPRQQLSQLDCQKNDPSPKSKMSDDPSSNDRIHDLNKPATDSMNHAAAEAAGRARAAASRDDKSFESLENLIVASGHNKVNEINIRCKAHTILGRKVKTFKSMVPVKRNQEDASNGSSSITSSFVDQYNFVECKMSVSPVVSSPEVYSNPAMATKEKKGEHHHNKAKRNEKDHDGHQQKAKRRKHHHAMNDIIHNRKRQVISHYVIQLEPLCDMAKKDTTSSQSSLSTDVEAGVLKKQRIVPSTVNTGHQNKKHEKGAEASKKEALGNV